MRTEGAWDVVIAGGGPSGTTAATKLRMLGHSVLLLEKTPHPRFRVGESLLPFTMDLLRELEFLPTLEQAGFVRKWGASFMLGDGSLSSTVYFSDGLIAGRPGSYQVTRSRFDQLLLDHCRTFGAEVREGHTVTDVQFDSDGATVTVRGPAGTAYELDARLFADATGRDTLLANRTKEKRMDPLLKKVAFFGYFEGARRDTGRDSGNTLSVVIRGGWIWFIPLEDDVTSVGVVIDAEDAKIARTGSAEALFRDVLARVPVMAERLAHARRVSPVRVTSDFSYSSRKLYGNRYLILGDAGFFLDPVFSSGVHLAILGGLRGAEAMHERLTSTSLTDPFRRYQTEMRRRQAIYVKFIYAWYRPGFLELFLSPTTKFKMLEAITTLLAGEPANWRVRMRMHLLFLLIQLNRVLPLAPPINRAELPGVVAQIASQSRVDEPRGQRD
jgi:flavin-dependent dehydrogenase